VLTGLYLLYKVASALQRRHPEWRPFLAPLVALYLLFVLATWLGEPLSNLFLRLHPLGRHALSRDERNAASATGVLLLLGVAYLFLFLLRMDRECGPPATARMRRAPLVAPAGVPYASPAGARA
jgi:hypothetical protein